MKHYSKRKEEVWEKGFLIPRKNPELYRKDKCGNVIYYHDYGKKTKFGWEIDHSKPSSKGGTNHLNNLQPLSTMLNKKKGNKYPFSCTNKKNRKKEPDFSWGTVALIFLGVLALNK